MSSPQWLPIELIIAQLETLDMCQSLFPLEGELVLDASTASCLPLLRQLAESTHDPTTELEHANVPAFLSFTVNLSVSDEPLSSDVAQSSLTISLPLAQQQTCKYVLHQASWLSRSLHDKLSQKLTEFVENGRDQDVFDVLEYARQASQDMYDLARQSARSGLVEEPAAEQRGPEWRVWFVLTSLSTREKRQDMVDWAPSYGLTGFVLAGKPALLVLEGTSSNVDKYMSDIKSKSWSDVPSFQKKVSERFRSPLSSSDPRAFSDMQEITHMISRGGHRGNRGDMSEVQAFLESKGLGDAFGVVLGNGAFA
ncbi:hypothetical protein OIV83_002121 [Microbotryomycetes sp. JL201]|nr:hypothetical protein OIV83_002121 [Microbotryomycetes sp. JL201]